MSSSSTDSGVYYCPEGEDGENVQLINQMLIVTYIEFSMMCLCSIVRTIYFIYVLHVVGKAQDRSFFKRLVFFSWLPLFNLICAVFAAVGGGLELLWTYSQDGLVKC